MKTATIYWTLGIIVALVVIGYFTNWFGMGTKSGAKKMQYGGSIVGGSIITNQNPVVVSSSDLDCAKLAGTRGTLKIDDHEFYCSGTFQCTPDGKITCQNPQYYYYPTYYTYGFPFFRGGFHGGGHHGGGGHHH